VLDAQASVLTRLGEGDLSLVQAWMSDERASVFISAP
jgi:hypothetical protein